MVLKRLAAYLNGLSSPLVEAPIPHRSATEAYLASLSQLAEQSNDGDHS